MWGILCDVENRWSGCVYGDLEGGFGYYGCDVVGWRWILNVC